MRPRSKDRGSLAKLMFPNWGSLSFNEAAIKGSRKCALARLPETVCQRFNEAAIKGSRKLGKRGNPTTALRASMRPRSKDRGSSTYPRLNR